MRDAETLQATLARLCMVKGISTVPKGHLRIETGFLYPDGSSVDVFLLNDPNATLYPPTRLSDLGQTMEFLLHHDVKPWTSTKRRQQLEDAISLYGVELVGGSLNKTIIVSKDSLQQGIILLGQACVRMADLLYTKRLQLQSVFTEDVEEFLGDADLRYEPAAELKTTYGPVKVDFLVYGRTTNSAVLALSSRFAAAAHAQANEVFRKVHDLHIAGRDEQRITLFDDTVDVARVYRDEDLRRLEQYSTVIGFSDRTATRELLAA